MRVRYSALVLELVGPWGLAPVSAAGPTPRLQHLREPRLKARTGIDRMPSSTLNSRFGHLNRRERVPMIGPSFCPLPRRSGEQSLDENISSTTIF